MEPGPWTGRHPELERRGVAPQPESAEAAQLVELLDLPVFTPDDDHDEEGPVREGAYQDFPLFETNADGVFCRFRAGGCRRSAIPTGCSCASRSSRATA